jgi:hypothetical protein
MFGGEVNKAAYQEQFDYRFMLENCVFFCVLAPRVLGKGHVAMIQASYRLDDQ